MDINQMFKDIPLEDRRSMMRLESTDRLKTRLAQYQSTIGGQQFVEAIKKQLALAELRDKLNSETIWAVCFCFGTGDPRGSTYCECPAGQAAEERHRLEVITARREEWDTRVMRNIAQAEIPSRYYDMTLDSSPINQKLLDRLREHSSESFFLWGEVGRGKTGLAVGLAKYACQHDESYQVPIQFLFRSVPKMLSDLRSTYGRKDGPTENEVIEHNANINLLILDDLGAEQVTSTGWLEDRLYQIIGERHAEERQTIFTSNLSLKDTGRRIGERLTWRIIEMCGESNIIHLDGPNLRDVKR